MAISVDGEDVCPPISSGRDKDVGSQISVIPVLTGRRIYVCDKEERYGELVKELDGEW